MIGVDEVGRGCLAGAVVSAAVFLKSDEGIHQFRDSKILSEKKRKELSDLIYSYHEVGIGIATPEEIDEINILQASLLSMKRACLELASKMIVDGASLLVDGIFKIPDLEWKQIPIPQGDNKVPVISAASIVAKVYRDEWMKRLAVQYPQYGFEKHKGYSSVCHKENIKKFGPTAIHRKSFRGVKEYTL